MGREGPGEGGGVGGWGCVQDGYGIMMVMMEFMMIR